MYMSVSFEDQMFCLINLLVYSVLTDLKYFGTNILYVASKIRSPSIQNNNLRIEYF